MHTPLQGYEARWVFSSYHTTSTKHNVKYQKQGSMYCVAFVARALIVAFLVSVLVIILSALLLLLATALPPVPVVE